MAGADPSGAAGLAMDERVCAALGAQFLGVTALATVQDRRGLHETRPAPPALIAAEMHAVLGAGQAGAVKLGALGTAAAVHAVARCLAAYPEVPVVCDPVTLATRTARRGARLLEEEALATVRGELLPRVALVMPNLAEAEWLSGGAVSDYRGMADAAERVLQYGAAAVLVKGGHLPADREIYDLFQEAGQDPEWLDNPRLPGGGELRGTGCALSTAAAVFLAQGRPAAAAVQAARARLRDWMQAALSRAAPTVFPEI